MSYELTGKLHKIFPTEQKTERFQAREFVVLLEDEQYPQYIKFQLTQDRCDLADRFQEGQSVKVHFDLRGREWNEKYFTNLNAWRLEPGEATSESPAEADFPNLDNEVTFQDEPDGSQDPDVDDLPF